ncbi:MAG TPA: hypothetical protein VFV52_01105 [Bacilli bacterium]|nr:hypothetical protein [Bacilli bacterium]
MNNKVLAGSAVLLSLSIVFAGWWVGHAITVSAPAPQAEKKSEDISVSDKGLWTEAEAAAYLGMTEERFEQQLVNETQERSGLSTYEIYRFVPFFVRDNKKYFSKEQLDEWIEYNIMNRTVK